MHDGMAGAVRGGGGVAVGGGVAAADVTALEAHTQMEPLAAHPQAVLAALDGGGQLRDEDVVQVGARRGHGGFSGRQGRGGRWWEGERAGSGLRVRDPAGRCTTGGVGEVY